MVLWKGFVFMEYVLGSLLCAGCLLPVVDTLRADPLPPHRAISFYDLRLSDGDRRHIFKLIKTMADKHIATLIRKQRKLRKLGDKIEPVHPLRFIAYIYEENELRRRMRTIMRRYFTWGYFIGGLGERLSKEKARGNLRPFIPEFAYAVGTQPEVIERYVFMEDWKGMVRCLFP
ncbi:MAG: hypothetical protein OXF02_03360 [Simkaniaceae bacterium]|nr:hypothetical protein [Simkaniaceae bacterium]